MSSMKERYINPFTDYGFKRLFGEEFSKDLLLDFLNELLKDEQGNIKDLTYKRTDKLGQGEDSRKAIFDLYCENERGEKFIVEMQKTKQKYFKDRTVYYSTFPIQEQAQQRSNWDFELQHVYTVAILDFVFDEDKHEKDKYRYDVKLSDIATQKVFYDKLTFVYLEMPKFDKKIGELQTRFEKWIYVLQNLNKLDRVPDELREGIFERVFEMAEIARFSLEEAQEYEESLKTYRDIKNSIDTARDEGEKKGREEGKIEGKIEIARLMISERESTDRIAKFTGLSKEEIEKLLKKG